MKGRTPRRADSAYSSSAPVFVVCALATLMLFVIVKLSLSTLSSSTPPNKLLLILVDGFRWDYFDEFSSAELPGFTKLRQNGVAADALIPVFPSLSFVNYYSIMTGNLQHFYLAIHDRSLCLHQL